MKKLYIFLTLLHIFGLAMSLHIEGFTLSTAMWITSWAWMWNAYSSAIAYDRLVALVKSLYK